MGERMGVSKRWGGFNIYIREQERCRCIMEIDDRTRYEEMPMMWEPV
jgi:hypothetical protein